MGQEIDLMKNYDENTYFFLCGNSLMVSEIYDKLIKLQYNPNKIFSEIFF